MSTTLSTTAAPGKSLPLPAFYDATKVGDVFAPNYAEIIGAAVAYRKEHNIKLRREVPTNARVCLLAIDQQATFSLENFELSLFPAAVKDSRNLCEFLYRNIHLITDTEVTLDEHDLWHIFHPVFWLDAQGLFIGPYTKIDPEDIGTKYFVNPEMCGIIFPHLKHPLRKLNWLTEYAIAYTRKLREEGKPPLVVWTIHGRYAHIGHALVPAFAAALDFHSIVRYSKTRKHGKGHRILAEAYSPFGTEVDTLEVHGRPFRAGRKAGRNVKRLLKYRVLVVAGEARSHCVRAALYDLLAAIKEVDPSLAGRVYILKDCTSNVPGFEAQGDSSLEDFAAAGMHVVESTTPMTEWPDMPQEVLRLAA
jgi:nicotinamidase-related amidase